MIQVNKVTVFTKKIEKREYPYIGINEHATVLFVKENCGISLMHNPCKETEVGYYFEDWLEDNFKLFEGEITISNEVNMKNKPE